MASVNEEFLLEALGYRQRLDLTGEVTGAVAHDLNNALSVVNGNVELLLERLQDPETSDDGSLLQDVQTAHNWSLTAMEAARRLLGFSRQLRMPARRTPANALAGEAAELCRYRCEMDGLLLMVDLAKDTGQFEAPPGQILQVLICMVQNAREAITRAGEKGSIHLSTVVSEGFIHFEVEDDGPGISPQIAEKIFELGFSTKQETQPAGLGLTVGRHIARANGGDLIMDATAEGGLQRLQLPRVSD